MDLHRGGGRSGRSVSRVRVDVSAAEPHAAAFLWRRDRRHRHRSEQTSVSERPGTNSSPHSTHARGSCFTRLEA
jgi:hypothetical protein